MYAVMGVTGKVGGAVAAGLIREGARVRAVMRDAAKARAWNEKGCEVAIARTEDAAALTAAFRDVEGVFAMLPGIFDPKPGFPEAKAAIESIRKSLAQARPSKVVCLSTIGADAKQPNLLNQLGLLEQALHSAPTPVTFLRPAWFLDNAAFDVASARSAGRIDSFLQPPDKQYPMVAARDVGFVASELLLDTWSGHRVVELEGPRRVTPNEIAQAFSTSLGIPIAARVVLHQDWEKLFRAQSMQNPTPRMQMLDGFNEGWIAFSDGGRHVRRGSTTLEQVIASIVKNG
jgi:NAD(P)H dehydrogenase (quinone)